MPNRRLWFFVLRLMFLGWPDGTRRAFDSTTGTSKILLEKLPFQAGTYTWRVAPYWTNSSYRYNWQQVCLLRTGGTFEKPDTNPWHKS